MQRNITAPAIAWLTANATDLALGALVAAGLVGLMLILRAVGHRLLAADPECRGWRGVIGRVLSRTTILFMVAAAIDIVLNYAEVPLKVARLADILFVIAAALQGAIWGREIILGVIASRVGDDDGSSTLGNAHGADPRARQRRFVRHRADRHPRQSRGQRHRPRRRARHRRHRHRPCRAGHLLRPVRRARDHVRPPVPPRRHDPLRRDHRHGRAHRAQDHAHARRRRRAGHHGQHQIARTGIAQPRRGQGAPHVPALRAGARHARRHARRAARDRRPRARLDQELPPGPLRRDQVRRRRDRCRTRLRRPLSDPDTLAKHKSAIIIAVVRTFAERGIDLAAAPAPAPRADRSLAKK